MNTGGEIGDSRGSRNLHSNAFGMGDVAFPGGGFAREDIALAGGHALDASDGQFKGLDQGRDGWQSLGKQDDSSPAGPGSDKDGKGGEKASQGNMGINSRAVPPPGAGSGWKLDGQGMGQRILGGQNFLSQREGDLSNSSGPSQVPTTKEVQYGLGGLIEVIKMTDKDRSALALGVDLLTLGLNLNSQESLYSFFNSPFSDQPSTVVENQFNTPQCYLMHPPPLKQEHLSKYQLETLFYVFFTAPRDIKQACAAQELYRREWRYHGELMLWLKPRGPQELMLGHPNVHFQYFDVNAWEARLFTNQYRGNLASGLLSEADVRVKTSPP